MTISHVNLWCAVLKNLVILVLRYYECVFSCLVFYVIYHPVNGDRVVVWYALRYGHRQDGVVDLGMPVPGIGHVGIKGDECGALLDQRLSDRLDLALVEADYLKLPALECARQCGLVRLQHCSRRWRRRVAAAFERHTQRGVVAASAVSSHTGGGCDARFWHSLSRLLRLLLLLLLLWCYF